MTESTAIHPIGRISPQDTGIWNDAQAEAWLPIVRFCQGQGALVGVQLGHAGRKASTRSALRGTEKGTWSLRQAVGRPSCPRQPASGSSPCQRRWIGLTLPRRSRTSPTPRYRRGLRCDRNPCGARIPDPSIPLAARQQPRRRVRRIYSNRTRLLLEVVDAVRVAMPADTALFVRMSATDWVPEGWDVDQTVEVASLLAEHGVDLLDCSTGGITDNNNVIPVSPGYQIQFAERVRAESGIATAAVGLITRARPGQGDPRVGPGGCGIPRSRDASEPSLGPPRCVRPGRRRLLAATVRTGDSARSSVTAAPKRRRKRVRTSCDG
ncbi:hypothetical protein BH24ACT5_BH24ACT5_32190 [soil metagenome]